MHARRMGVFFNSSNEPEAKLIQSGAGVGVTGYGLCQNY